MQTTVLILMVSAILRTGAFDYSGRNVQSERTSLDLQTGHRAS